MLVLIAVASKHGSTREIAEDLRTASVAVDLRDAGDVASITGYTAVVLGSGMYAGSWLPDAKHFAEQHRAELARLPVWVFSSGPLGADEPQTHDDPQKLAAPLGDVPVRDHRVFVGKLNTQGLGFGECLMVKVVGAPEAIFGIGRRSTHGRTTSQRP